MMNIKQLISLNLVFLLPLVLDAQEVGRESFIINSLGEPRESGFFQAYSISGADDVPDTAHSWTHMINSRHTNTSSHHALQIASSYATNDRLFFRKIGTSLVTYNPTWNELATRASNTFSGNQIINGNVGIGTTNTSGSKLSVAGIILAQEVIVETGWADYVFAEGYKLASLDEVEAHINERGHLPGVPSAEDVQTKGLSLGDSQTLMMAKIEELTLYLIEKDKEIKFLLERVNELENRN